MPRREGLADLDRQGRRARSGFASSSTRCARRRARRTRRSSSTAARPTARSRPCEEADRASRVISEPGANISRGRNVAIAAAAHDVIAATDADCTLAPDWLERLLAPIEAGADVSAGFYRPEGDSFLQACMAAVSLPRARGGRPGLDAVVALDRVSPRRRSTLPAGIPNGSRSARTCTSTIGCVSSGVRMDNATDAVVYWRIRPTLGETWTQYAGYAEGDALAGMYPERHFLRFAVYGLGALAAHVAQPLPDRARRRRRNRVRLPAGPPGVDAPGRPAGRPGREHHRRPRCDGVRGPGEDVGLRARPGAPRHRGSLLRLTPGRAFDRNRRWCHCFPYAPKLGCRTDRVGRRWDRPGLARWREGCHEGEPELLIPARTHGRGCT